MQDVERINGLFTEAFACAKKGEAAKALQLYDEVTALAPGFRNAWFNKALLLEWTLKRPDEAIRCYLRAVDIQPTDLASTRSIGVLYYRSGEFGKARYWLEKLINWGEKHPELLRMHQRCVDASRDRDLVFVSYSWSDREFVLSLLPELDREGIEYFIDRDRIPQDEALPELRWQIEQGLAQSDAVLLVCSERSLRSPWVNIELCSAIAMIKKVTVLVLDGAGLPESLQRSAEAGRIHSLSATDEGFLPRLLTCLRSQVPSADGVARRNDGARVSVVHAGQAEFELVQLDGGRLPDFAIGRRPVTQCQWEAVMGANPAMHKGDPARPVENVSWDDAVAFVGRLHTLSGVPFRLPTDFEWEYACRAGSVGNWSSGDDEDGLLQYAWCSDNAGPHMARWTEGDESAGGHGKVLRTDGDGKSTEMEVSRYETNSVFTKRPNRWGIYHMHGNVQEWCADVSPKSEQCRSVRGGSYRSSPRDLRCAARGAFPHGQGSPDLGFRLCCTAGAIP